MTPHKLTLERVAFVLARPSSFLTFRYLQFVTLRRVAFFTFLFLIVGSSSAQISFSKTPSGGRLAVVVDERLAALRSTPDLRAQLIRRLGRGRIIAIRGSRIAGDGVVFLLVNVTSRTHGWIQREAVVSGTRAGDDRRLLDLINASEGFDRIVRARIFLDNFVRSPLRPQVLLLLSNAAEEQAAKLSRDAAQRLSVERHNASSSTMPERNTSAPEFTYFLNYTGLDRYNRQRVGFTFDRATKRFHYDGAALRELIRRYPNSPEAIAARKRLAQLAQLKKLSISLLTTADAVSCVAMICKRYKPKGETIMGLTHVAVTIKNVGSENSFTANFLVDTGAIDSLAPESELKRMGIKPSGKRRYELASGEVAEYEFAWAEFSFLGETITSRIIFGPGNAEPLLGVLALEAVGLVIDPVTQRLKKLYALPLKAVA